MFVPAECTTAQQINLSQPSSVCVCT